MKFLLGLFTDAKDRPEVKILLGAPIAVASAVYGMATRDWTGFAALSGFALLLLGVTAYADHNIDKGAS